MATPLTEDERRDLAAAHPSWAVEGEEITRTFVFTDFAEAMGFVGRVALAAEKADHHPNIDIRWNKVTLMLTTHSAGALTERDRALVEMIDDWEE